VKILYQEKTIEFVRLILSDDFNESDVLRKQLMPDTKVVIRLKSNVFPTIYKTKSDDPTLTLPSTSRCERQNRKRENQFISTSFKSNTPVKKIL